MTTEVVAVEDRDTKRQAALLKAIGLDRVPAEQREIALAIAKRYELDLLLKHLVLVDGRPYITRDGLLHVAHRSGVLDGIEVSDPELVDMPGAGSFWTARASVYRKDMSRPFTYQGRYPAKGGNQRYAPEMATKVAEVMALRRAFDVSAPVIEERWDIDTAPQPEAVPLREQVAARRAAIVTVVPEPDADVPPLPADPAGALAATPDLDPGSADPGEPTPATCSALSPYEDGLTCTLKAGHRNAHSSGAGTWT
jgi:hypothetical protein